jgi:glycine hydroxymethyltransferase
MVMCQAKWQKELDRLTFPGIQGGPLVHVIAAKAVSFKEALLPEFKVYQHQIVANAKALAETLTGEGWRLVSGGTDNHLMLIYVFSRGITGKVAEKALENAGITVNKNTIPYDTNSPMVASGIRIGTPALTTRGMKEAEMRQVGVLIARALSAVDDETALADVRRDVGKMCDNFPLYAARLESYDRALARV